MFTLSKQLLPGISDDVTLTHIATKMPWTAFQVLLSVSRAWLQAIQSREVYRERMRTLSTETLVVVRHCDFILLHFSLFYERKFYKVPPIPHIGSRIAENSHFISIEGKLYVLGAGADTTNYTCGIQGSIYYESFGRAAGPHMPIYALDLAGQREWKECANIEEPERKYVLKIGSGFEAGGKHFVRGGSPNWFRSFWQECDKDKWNEEGLEWRGVQPEYRGSSHLLNVQTGQSYSVRKAKCFMVHGEYYKKGRPYLGEHYEIKVYDVRETRWKKQHSISCHEIESDFRVARLKSSELLVIDPFYILPLNGELLALASWKRYHEDGCWHYYHGQGCWHHDRGFCLVQTKGFGTQSEEKVWQNSAHISPSTSFGSKYYFALCPIQL